MPSYLLFHRSLDSSHPLRTLPDGPADPGALRLRFEACPDPGEPREGAVLHDAWEDGRRLLVRRTESGLDVAMGQADVQMRIRLGKEEWSVLYAGGVTPEDVEGVLVTAGLKALVGELGVPFLHASGTVLRGRAAVFLGLPGAGKSTAAGALVLHAGHRLLADDVVPWVETPSGIEVHPGPSLLLAERGGPLGAAPLGPLLVGRGEFPKRSFLLPRASPGPVPLGAIFVLAPTTPGVEPLRGREAWHALAPHFGTGHRPVGAPDLERLASLSRRVRVIRLGLSRDLPLEAFAATLHRHVEAALQEPA